MLYGFLLLIYVILTLVLGCFAGYFSGIATGEWDMCNGTFECTITCKDKPENSTF